MLAGPPSRGRKEGTGREAYGAPVSRFPCPAGSYHCHGLGAEAHAPEEERCASACTCAARPGISPGRLAGSSRPGGRVGVHRTEAHLCQDAEAPASPHTTRASLSCCIAAVEPRQVARGILLRHLMRLRCLARPDTDLRWRDLCLTSSNYFPRFLTLRHVREMHGACASAQYRAAEEVEESLTGLCQRDEVAYSQLQHHFLFAKLSVPARQGFQLPLFAGMIERS